MKARIYLFILTLSSVALMSCGDDQQFQNGDTIYFPDTAALKQSWQMEESQMRSDLFAADSSYNQLGLDTFELTYMQCDCPDWYDASTLYLNCKECSEFYVEPADPMLAFPQPFLVSRNIVRFYGVRIPGLNLPANRKFNEPNPPAATVFRYYGYEVLRPYKIWGSQMKRFLDPADTIMEDVKLTIR